LEVGLLVLIDLNRYLYCPLIPNQNATGPVLEIAGE
jgi:hypothetical protein